MTVVVSESIADVRERLSESRRAGATIGLVPTMGALHAGHEQLMAQARRECGLVAVSIFVNPLQFDRTDDLQQYPRTLDADLDLCRRLGVDVVFAPSADEIYPAPQECVIEVGRLGDHLCGRGRPGHFRGVATVVMKLLQITRPDRAYFGEKDAQQLAVIRRLVRDFAVPVTIVGVPTVRETDGLALSSRNRRLSPAERERATVLYRALRHAQGQIAAGATDAAAIVRLAAEQVPQDATIRIEYLEIVDTEDLQPVVGRITGPVLAAGAIWFGTTRLIDNVICHPSAAR